MKKIFKFTIFLFVGVFLFIGNANAETGEVQLRAYSKFKYKYRFEHESRSGFCPKQILSGTNHRLYNFHIPYNEAKPLYDIYSEDVISTISKASFEKIRKIAYYGDMLYNDTQNELYYFIVNGLIIKALGPDEFIYYERDEYTDSVYEETEKFLEEEIDAYFVKPSFDNEEIEINLNDSFTISDKNNILSSYQLVEILGDSISYEIVDNKISLKAIKPGVTTFRLKKEYNDKDYNMELLYEEGDESFAITPGNFTLYSNFSVKVNASTIALEIKDDESLFSDEGLEASYGIYNQKNELVYQINTNVEGIFYTDYLSYGTYYIKEISNSSAYEKNNTVYKVNLSDDEPEMITIQNRKKSFSINLDNKTGNCYELFTSTNKYLNTYCDSTKISLGLGEYVLRNQDEEVNFNTTNANETITLEKLRKVTISFLDEEGRIINDDIHFSIMDEDYQSNGKKFISLRDGNYLIKILNIPDGYVLENDTKLINVNDNMNIEIVLKYREEGIGSEIVDIDVPNTFSFNYFFIFIGLRYVKKFSKW